MSFVEDNYGAKWVKQILNWIYYKTYPSGYSERLLLRDAVFECGLRKGKTLELLREYMDVGIVEMKEHIVYWVDGEVKPINIKMKPYKDSKKEVEKEGTFTPNEILEIKQKEMYSLYMKNCINDNETPKSFDEWVADREGEV